MSSFLIGQDLSKELDTWGLSNVVHCPVCRGFTKANLIQLHEIANTCQTCPGCFFLQGVFDTIQTIFNLPSGPWTPLILTSWKLWGTEHFLTIARCQRQKLGPFHVPKILEEANFFEVFTMPGERCPWPKIPSAKVLSGDTGSPTSMYILHSWLSNCARNHRYCRHTDEVELPARVLKIIRNDGEPRVQLIETNGTKRRYFCLSHRWITGQTITTTTDNIEQRKVSIPWVDLPKTFKEAIIVTRDLGFEYIWIDSLCINQEKASGDWLVEAPKMAQYYQNSFLTISAAESTEGLFYKHTNGAQVLWQAEPPEQFKGRWPSYNICIREPLAHDASTLHSRGWVFQEHLLSPRVVHFGKELVWECTELTACECGRFPLPTDGGQAPLADISDIGNVVNTYARKPGHMLALSSLRPATRFYVELQAVYVKPIDNAHKDAEEIAHYLFIQKQAVQGNGITEDTEDVGPVDRPDKVPTQVQPPNGVDSFIPKIVFLQSSGIQNRAKAAGEATQPALMERNHTQGNLSISDSPQSSNRENRITVYPTPLLHSRWLDIVAHYTRRKLTFGNDILPALAGLAKQFQPKFECDYFAGMWEKTIAMDLLWRSRKPEKHSNQSNWRAPSWSWASAAAAVDYYHMLIWFELDTHTFRYVLSDIYISDVKVECVPLDGDDMTMRLRSAKMTLKGRKFRQKLPEAKAISDSDDDIFSDLTAKEIEAQKGMIENAILLPGIEVPEDDIRFFPLARCMDNQQTVTWLVNHTGMMFLTKRNSKINVRPFTEFWPDYHDESDAEKGLQEVDCLLIAKHMSAMDRCYFSLVLKPTPEPGTYERVGLLRHKDMLCDAVEPGVINVV